MCDEIERLGAQFVALRAMQLAAFFHDVIYDVSRQDNELHSADELMQRLSDLADHDELELAANAIRATASHAATGDADIDLFVDIDMGVLGAPWPAYARYAHGVWAEFVPVYGETAFRHGRLELFLQPLLSCGEVFITRQFQPRTQLALNNLKREADILAAGQAVTPVC
jgi:predicted metal-dependent HD superfamily phosphohydrolase